MLKEFIDRIISLAPAREVVVGGQTYTAGSLKLVTDPSPAPTAFHTLTGLVDYINSTLDPKFKVKDELALLVSDPASVSLISTVTDQAQRHQLAVSSLAHPVYEFGAWRDQETFIIALQSLFLDTPPRATLLTTAGSVTEEGIQTSADDGITQTVTARAGVVLANRVTIPNPVTLRPWRTFREVEQPLSAFVLRVRKGHAGGVEFALFEADGGVWKHQAMKNIAGWLRQQLPNGPVVLA